MIHREPFLLAIGAEKITKHIASFAVISPSRECTSIAPRACMPFVVSANPLHGVGEESREQFEALAPHQRDDVPKAGLVLTDAMQALQ
jgi:hypothetical protein